MYVLAKVFFKHFTRLPQRSSVDKNVHDGKCTNDKSIQIERSKADNILL